MSILEAAFLLRFAPEHFVIAIRVERRVDINQIDAGVGKLPKLIEIIAAVDDTRVDERRRLNRHFVSKFAEDRLFGQRAMTSQHAPSVRRLLIANRYLRRRAAHFQPGADFLEF